MHLEPQHDWKIVVPGDPYGDTYYRSSELDARKVYFKYKRDDSCGATLYRWSAGAWTKVES